MGLLSAEEFFVIVGAVAAVVVHLVVHIVAGIVATQTSRSAHGAVAAVVG